MRPPVVDVEQRLTEAGRRGDTDGYLRLLAAEQIFVPVRRTDADALLNGDAGSFPELFHQADGRQYRRIFTRGAIPDALDPPAADGIVFTSGALDWAVTGADDDSWVLVNQGDRSELRIGGAELLAWLAANKDLITPLREQHDLLLAASYGPLDGPVAHALACGAHLAVHNATPWNLLDRRRLDYLEEVRGLRDWWGVGTAADWQQTMDALIGNDYQLTTGNLALMLRLEHAATHHLRDSELDLVVWRDALAEWCEDTGAGADTTAELRAVAGTITRYEQRFRADGLIAEDDYVTTTIAWDLGRAVNVVRWGLTAGHCDELTAELLVLEAGAAARRYHQSWNDFSAGYIMGRLLHFDGEEFGDWYLSALRVHRLLSTAPDSPWRYLDFDPTPPPGRPGQPDQPD